MLPRVGDAPGIPKPEQKSMNGLEIKHVRVLTFDRSYSNYNLLIRIFVVRKR